MIEHPGIGVNTISRVPFITAIGGERSISGRSGKLPANARYLLFEWSSRGESDAHRLIRRNLLILGSNRTSQIQAAPGTEPVPLEDILVTHKLKSHRRRKPNFHAESATLPSLAQVMTSSPNELVDTLLRMALELCSAGSMWCDSGSQCS